MSAQHTPGPWSYTDVRSQGTLVYHRIDAPGRLLGFAGTYRDGRKIAADAECEANARLIAASPDLLKALADLMPTNLGALPDTMPDSATLPLDVTFGELRRARAAIAKAEGL